MRIQGSNDQRRGQKWKRWKRDRMEKEEKTKEIVSR